MESYVFIAVLVAAACHAGWNATLKTGIDPFATTALIITMSGLIGLCALPFAGLPAFDCWPWLLLSLIVHVGYFWALTEAYRTGDVGQVYPIARGTAPLMTAGASVLFVGETMSAVAWGGIALLTFGVLFLSTHGGRDIANVDRRALTYAFITAVTVCAYSIADGLGGRASANPVGYAILVFITNAITMLLLFILRRGVAHIPAVIAHWKVGLGGAVMSFLAYTIAIWAMTKAPIALVAALRETSVLFAAVIAIVVLKEPLRLPRIAAALMIVGGLALIRLA